MFSLFSVALPAWLVIFAASVYALPATSPASSEPLGRSVTDISTAQLSSYSPYAQFARAAYCPGIGKTWNCGPACAATTGFQSTLNGGDGGALQFYFVGYYPALNTIIVSHQGTDPTELESVLTDVNIDLRPLSSTLFPGRPSNVEVHDGFADQHAMTAKLILAEVKALMASTGTKKVTTVGHSLGGALAQLDALYLTLNLPGATIKSVTYGTPRVGNPEYAAFFDKTVGDYTRINNREDLVPIIPGRFLGFAHPKGEVHIISDGHAVACSGSDNAVDAQCQIQTVPNIFEGNIIDHLGPYEGLYMGTIFC